MEAGLAAEDGEQSQRRALTQKQLKARRLMGYADQSVMYCGCSELGSALLRTEVKRPLCRIRVYRRRAAASATVPAATAVQGHAPLGAERAPQQAPLQGSHLGPGLGSGVRIRISSLFGNGNAASLGRPGFGSGMLVSYSGFHTG